MDPRNNDSTSSASDADIKNSPSKEITGGLKKLEIQSHDDQSPSEKDEPLRSRSSHSVTSSEGANLSPGWQSFSFEKCDMDKSLEFRPDDSATESPTNESFEISCSLSKLECPETPDSCPLSSRFSAVMEASFNDSESEQSPMIFAKPKFKRPLTGGLENAAALKCSNRTSSKRLFQSPAAGTGRLQSRENSRCTRELFCSPKSMFSPKPALHETASENERGTPRQNKKRKCVQGDTPTLLNGRNRAIFKLQGHKVSRNKPTLREWFSGDDGVVKQCFESQELIGDWSKTHLLPTVIGQHQDLKSITPQTLSEVLSGEYDEKIGECVIIDCRYPYEYKGGHIETAMNLYTHEVIDEVFLKSTRFHGLPTVQGQGLAVKKSTILVFHCEFSSERAPKLCRYLRNRDRELHTETYPDLYFPEIYLLNGGYKGFYLEQKNHCVPQTYKPMLHQDHVEELKKFQAQSRSVAPDKLATTVKPKGLQAKASSWAENPATPKSHLKF